MTPPPWTLDGWGLIALYHLPQPFRVGALMLVRYHASPVGPYDELLWATWPHPSPAGPRPQVAQIVVDSAPSVTWGRHNWGIPKGLARFDWSGTTAQQVRVHTPGGEPLAHLGVQTLGPRVPLHTAALPAPLRTLAQPALDGSAGWLLTTLSAQGQGQLARLTVLDCPLVPELAYRRPALTLAVPRFRLVFPEPQQRWEET